MPTSSEFHSIEEVASQLAKAPYAVRRLIEEGRVPFAEKLAGQWMLLPASLAFLREWRDRMMQRGVPGQRAAVEMRTAAAKLDPACKTRTAAWSKAYPRGWAANRKPKAKKQAAKKSR